MAEALSGLKRTMMCGEPREEHVGKKVTLMGWVQRNRKLGGLQFIDLRDRTGIMQVVFGDDVEEEIFEKAKGVRPEYCVAVTGEIVLRQAPNKDLETGLVELKCEDIKILSESETPPIYIKEDLDAAESIRLKYRYLDLRRPDMQKIFFIRNRASKAIRDYLDNNGFLEVETPILTKSTPEGARDYLVPSRNYPGMFYALPQSPQIFKQLLMCSGFNRYFQIAPCFRDEDPRSDRLYGEFYQLDLEMSFATDEDVYEVGEKIFYDIFTHFSDKEVSPRPFRRIPYREAMLKYGSDKPDLRNPLIIDDITDILSKSTFEPFKTSHIRGITVTNIDKSNSWYKSMEEYMKSVGAVGLSYIKVNEDMTFKSSIDKFLDDSLRKELIDKCHLVPGSALFVLADSKNKINKLAGLLRIKLGSELDLIDKNKYEFCIVNDFPMYEYNEEDGKFDFGHNPFSMPQGGLEALKEDNLENVLAYQYDFVCNGYEMASGAVRNHDIKIMKRAFELAGYTEEDVETKFRSLYTAFQYGAPPHAGMAPGIDRILMLLKDEENIREMVAFPLGANGADAMMGCPGEVFEKQLRETHIKVRD